MGTNIAEIFAHLTFALATIVALSKKDWYHRPGIWHTDLPYKMRVLGLRFGGRRNVMKPLLLNQGLKDTEPFLCATIILVTADNCHPYHIFSYSRLRSKVYFDESQPLM